MKFHNIPKITQRIDLAEYHESFAGQVVDVWVNPPRAVKAERERIAYHYALLNAQLQSAPPVAAQKSLPAFFGRLFEFAKGTHEQRLRALTTRMQEWFVQVWNAGDEPQWHWTANEVQLLYESDPAMFGWLTTRTVKLMEEWRTEQKKT